MYKGKKKSFLSFLKVWHFPKQYLAIEKRYKTFSKNIFDFFSVRNILYLYFRSSEKQKSTDFHTKFWLCCGWRRQHSAAHAGCISYMKWQETFYLTFTTPPAGRIHEVMLTLHVCSCINSRGTMYWNQF